MLTYTKTGAMRYRVHKPLFGAPLLVLQIEIHRKGFEVMDSYGSSFDRDDTFWRDATVEDISEGLDAAPQKKESK